MVSAFSLFKPLIMHNFYEAVYETDIPDAHCAKKLRKVPELVFYSSWFYFSQCIDIQRIYVKYRSL
ncbi:hypothetical protein JL49_18080 [Pseudoalteromonas luteoviolacea]|nr:hypothetical protein JL49_18080 [Pseudoalteromonas luteoviolacea]